MKDTVWLRGERAPRKDVTIVEEGAEKFVFTENGEKREVEGWRVRAVRHADSPRELRAALARIPEGDFATAEKQLDLLVQKENAPEWLKIHASFHRANAQRLRASLEGTGHYEAASLLGKWLERHGDHRLAPAARFARGEGLLESDLAEAYTEFTRLAELPGEPWQLLARWGHAKGGIMGRPSIELKEKARSFEKLEAEALAAEWGHEAAQLARIGRAEMAGALGAPGDGALLLAEVLDLEAWQGTPARVRAWNVLAELCVDMGGRTPDGAATTVGLLAALPFWMKVVRYSVGLPLERARALAGAHKASLAAGAKGRAAHLKKELLGRFATSTWAKSL
jgi:hypothetical protein